MKSISVLICSFIIVACTSMAAKAQDQKSGVPSCSDTNVHRRLVTLNDDLSKKSYQLTLMRSVLVPNGGLQPVTVDLQAGKEYKVNFVPNREATKISITIIDKDRNTVAKVKAGDGQTASATFQAKTSGTYLIVVSQKIKGGFLKKSDVRDICGGVSIMSK